MRLVQTGKIPATERLLCAAMAVAILTVLGIGAWLDADPTGFGTHTQLGLDECSFVAMFGYPCASCGMTTAFTHAADFSLLQSFLAQPAGAVYAVTSAAAFWVLLYVACTGSPAGRTLVRAVGGKVLWGGLILLGAAWAYKVVTWPTVP
ncbi:MAG: DUF2752 domain-containing protein [Phycisphaerales bacterium JB065]